MRLKRQQTWRIREHRARVRLSEASAAEQFEKCLSMRPSQVCIGFAFSRLIPKIAPSVDHLLGRAAADSQL
jgi:hypothetical protein